jgi:phospholipid/cholesterol/gamma-HCH transport system ATP-binding protein
MRAAEAATGETREARGPVHIEVRGLRFARGERPIFAGLDCRFLRGRINVILGGSGSGKTTLLRMLGCLARPDAGSILVDGALDLAQIAEAEIRRYRRRIGMMFQDGALLDSLSLQDNVALPLREHSEHDEAEIARRVEEVFASVGLEGVGPLLPAQLSGGMRKRAALARALVMQPEILLCDEPFSGLDPATVRLVEDLLVDLNRRLHVTMVIASHHLASTFRMAAHVVLLVEGRALEGGPAAFLRHADPRVEQFLAGELPV